MTRNRLVALALFVFLMGVAVLLPLSAVDASTHTSQAQAASVVKNRFKNIPVTGTTANGGTFKGKLDITSFSVSNGTLMANGTITGNVKNAAGQVVANVANQAVSQAVSLPTAITQATCTVLTLTLGPLDLNLLGLMVHLNQVVLDITANPAGGLLGQLLCDIANLNLSGLLGQIATDLNQIIALLGV